MLKDRLTAALARNRALTKAGLARACKVSKPSVTDWFTGKTQELKADNYIAAAEYLGVDADWLRTGNGKMERGAFLRPISVWDESTNLDPAQFVYLPMIDVNLSCGGGAEPGDIENTDRTLPFTAGWVRKQGWSPKTHFTMRADGVSMEPTIQDCSPVVIDASPSAMAVKSGKVYAIRINGELLLKRLDRLPGDRLRVRSDNQAPDYAPFEVNAADVHIIGRAVWTPVTL